MIRRSGRVARRRTICFGLMLAAAGGAPAAWAAAVAVTVVADDACAPQIRAVIAEQLAGLTTSVTFSCAGRADAEEPFRATRTPAGDIQLWVDVSVPDDARLAVRDYGDRFVVRRVPLARGLDEVGREEIGQIVRSAVLALLAGPRATLSRAEARAAISTWPVRAPPSPSAPPPAADPGRSSPATRSRPSPSGDAGTPWRGLVELGAAATVRVFSTAIPVVGEVGLVAGIGSSSAASFWMEGAYRIPARALMPAIGLEIRAMALRGGVALSSDRGGGRRVGLRAGLGAGFERTSFSPRSTGGEVDLAPGESFLVVTGRALAGVELRAAAHFRIGLTAFCDVQTRDVHYDLHAADGSAHRVLTPFRLQPGLTLSVSGWLGP